ncbi:MAG: hypothetical protein U9R79_22480 [Armatimonadota bacterium]|nr:hypothetical protein [Armatimonadota bacterium]
MKMKVELEQAIDSYRAGLLEIKRLTEDEAAPYQQPLLGTATNAYFSRIAETLELCFDSRESVDDEALAEMLREFDLSRADASFKGGPWAYLFGVLANLYMRTSADGETRSGILARDDAVEFSQWCDRLFDAAGYSDEDLARAWRRVLRTSINVWGNLGDQHRDQVQTAIRQQLARLLASVPPRLREDALDDELEALLEELGLGLIEIVDIQYEVEGREKHIRIPTEQLWEEATRSIVDALRGHETGPSDSGLRHIVRVSPRSLVIKHIAAPDELVELGYHPEGEVRARLSFHLLSSADRGVRQAAWEHGLEIIDAASDDLAEVELQLFDQTRRRWLGLKERLLTDDPSEYEPAAIEARRALAGMPSVIARSMMEASAFGAEPVLEVLRLVTPGIVHGWLKLSPEDFADAQSLERAASRHRPKGRSSSALLDEAAIRLCTPFRDAALWRQRIWDALGDNERGELIDGLLRRAERTACACFAANVAVMCMEQETAQSVVRSTPSLRDRLAAIVADTLMPHSLMDRDAKPVRPEAAQLLEYKIAERLYYSWRTRGDEVGQGNFEQNAYLSICAGSLLSSVLSQASGVAAEGEGDMLAELAEAVRLGPEASVLWHLEPEDANSRLNPLRNWSSPWAALLLLAEANEHREFFCSDVADADVGNALFALAEQLSASAIFWDVPSTRRTWLEDHLSPEAHRLAVDLLLAARSHAIPYWPDSRQERVRRLEEGLVPEDLDREVAETIAEGAPDTAAYVMGFGLVYGPLDYDAWITRLLTVLEQDAVWDRIMDEPVLLHQALNALVTAAVVATTREETLPDALRQRLLSNEDLPPDHIARFFPAVAQALWAGARLDGATEWLERRVLETSGSQELASQLTEQLVAIVESGQALIAVRASIEDMLRRLAMQPPFSELAQLRRYRQGDTDE